MHQNKFPDLKSLYLLQTFLLFFYLDAVLNYINIFYLVQKPTLLCSSISLIQDSRKALNIRGKIVNLQTL